MQAETTPRVLERSEHCVRLTLEALDAFNIDDVIEALEGQGFAVTVLERYIPEESIYGTGISRPAVVKVLVSTSSVRE
jgi:hypothetical protein